MDKIYLDDGYNPNTTSAVHHGYHSLQNQGVYFVVWDVYPDKRQERERESQNRGEPGIRSGLPKVLKQTICLFPCLVNQLCCLSIIPSGNLAWKLTHIPAEIQIFILILTQEYKRQFSYVYIYKYIYTKKNTFEICTIHWSILLSIFFLDFFRRTPAGAGSSLRQLRRGLPIFEDEVSEQASLWNEKPMAYRWKTGDFTGAPWL